MVGVQVCSKIRLSHVGSYDILEKILKINFFDKLTCNLGKISSVVIQLSTRQTDIKTAGDPN